MRALAVLLTVLMLTPTALALADHQTVEMDWEVKAEKVLPTYSKQVQIGFAQMTDLDRYTKEELTQTHEWLVVTTIPADKQLWTDARPESVEKIDFMRGVWVWTLNDPASSIDDLTQMQEEGLIEAFYPLIPLKNQRAFTPNDTHWDDHWHMDNTGQFGGTAGVHLNLTGVWDNYRGNGVTISVNDDAFDNDHEDLDGNYVAAHSWDWCDGDSNPHPEISDDWHGTASAGVAGAEGNNSVGVVGAAFEADMAGNRMLVCGLNAAQTAQSMVYHNDDIDVSSNSWMWVEATPGENLDPLVVAAYEDNVYNGRNGLGQVMVYANGNGGDYDGSTNQDPFVNSRFTIPVTAVTNYGYAPGYAEWGPHAIVAGYSSGGSFDIPTTDHEYDYINDFGGTSAAVPGVSGSIALMLEANPNLTWRDVLSILIESAQPVDSSDSSWNTNGAGHDVSHLYGFGRMDAGIAVDMAETWTNIDLESNMSLGRFNVNQNIPDNSNSWTTHQFTVTDQMTIESVEVILDITHSDRGDLEIVLESPMGYESWLMVETEDSTNNWDDYYMSTMHHWGEEAQGTWTVKVRDVDWGSSGTFNYFEVEMHGTVPWTDSDSDGLSNMEETSVYGTDPYDNDTDDDLLHDGDEVLNWSTDPLDSDTDDDGLMDGVEVHDKGSDPLVADADSDSDSWYWFEDCDDEDAARNPDAQELLNGIDDDCDEVVDNGFTGVDTDADGLDDYDEYHFHGTDYEDSDTDDDGLSDGSEIAFGSDPLVVDEDADGDGWHWFRDCDDENAERYNGAWEKLDGIDNDCDDEVDEGYENFDSDSDGLNDWDEYHVHGTNHGDADTDGDGIDDGAELSITETDPLVADPDADEDGYYWFEDCADDDATRFPANDEVLDGKDNDCDDLIDEGSHGVDSDDDGVDDYDEYHVHGTDAFDADSDGDGLEDGRELTVTMTDPLVPDPDADEDGFYHFEDCNDDISSMHPGADERWNGVDDDCDSTVDEGVDRSHYLSFDPGISGIKKWDSDTEKFFAEVEDIPQGVDFTITRDLDGINVDHAALDDGDRLVIPKVDCSNKVSELDEHLCEAGSGAYQLNMHISDSGTTTTFVWVVDIDVKQPESSSLGPTTIAPGIIALAMVTLLAAMLVGRRER